MLARTFIRRINPQGVARPFGAAAVDPLYKASELSNGVQIVCKDAAANLVSLKFAVLGGSSAETEAEKGAAHLLSVAAFAGTGSKSGLRLMRELEDIGATVSASADREKITLDVTVLASMAELAFERLADAIVSAPKNSKVALADCYGQAQLAYDAAAEPKHRLAELLHEAAFGEASPMGASQLAFNADLSNLTTDAVMAYRQHQFTANNLVVASSGLKHTVLKQYTEKYLSSLARAAGTAAAAAALPGYVGGDAKQRADLGGRTYVALAFPMPAGAKAHNVLRLMLNNRLRDAGSVSALHAPYAQGGLWGFYADADSADGANKLIEKAVSELRAAGAAPVAAEVEAAKVQLSLQKTAELEGGQGQTTCALLSAYMTKSSPRDYANFASVSAADVSAAAKACLASTPAWAVLGKTAGAHSFPAVCKLLKA